MPSARISDKLLEMIGAGKRRRLVFFLSGVLLLFAAVGFMLPRIGSALILHPPVRHLVAKPPPTLREATFKGEGVDLKGWFGEATGTRRGTVIYLHGVADNRASGQGVLERFQKQGFDVVAYDSRAHGESGGTACTYGFYEKEDLRRVIDTLAPGPLILIGSSLGGSVALQLAASDPRITAIVAAEAFSDLRTVVTQRAPIFFTPRIIKRSLGRAEQGGHFEVDAASPVLAAPRIRIPVMIIHGAEDVDTPPDHARRIHAALAGRKRLVLVPGAAHNESLQGDDIWEEIELWIKAVAVP